jgi:hypothetical protein
MGLIRFPDWRKRLLHYVAGVSRARFQAGKLDCALFAAGAVHAMTGADLARGWRKYRSLKKGRALLADKGFADHVALAASLLPEIPPSFASVGDIAVLTADEDDALGVVQGPNIWALRPDGLGTVPLTQAKRAFRV